MKTNAPYEIEFRAVRPDGNIIWIFTNAILLRDEEGPARMIGATVDVSAAWSAAEHLQAWNADLERRVTERTSELQQSHEQLRALAADRLTSSFELPSTSCVRSTSEGRYDWYATSKNTVQTPTKKPTP